MKKEGVRKKTSFRDNKTSFRDKKQHEAASDLHMKFEIFVFEYLRDIDFVTFRSFLIDITRCEIWVVDTMVS